MGTALGSDSGFDFGLTLLYAWELCAKFNVHEYTLGHCPNED